MLRVAKLSVAAIGVWAALIGAPARAQTKCELAQIAAIPVVFRHNRPLVEVSINGHKARMLADTGSSKTILFAQAVEALGLHPVGSDVDFMGVGGTRRAKEVTVSELGFGGSTARNLRLFVLDGAMGGDVAGVFGFDLLGQTSVEFDLGGGFIRLFDEKNCPRTNLAYWSKDPTVADLETAEQEFKIPLQLNGVTIHASLDSGASTSVITSEAAARARGQALPSPTDTVGGLGAKRVEVTIMLFASLAIGDEEIKNTKLLAGDYFRETREAETNSHIKRSVADETDMLLGADFLRSHRVVISAKQKRIYFTYAGGPVFQVVAPAEDKTAETAAK